MYTAPKNPRTNQEIFPPVEPGSELGWSMLLAGPEPFSAATDQFRYVVFKDPNWDWRTLNFDSDVALADKIDNHTINAIDPNLKPFLARGGKLLMYHGWADPGVAPRASVNYYKAAVDSSNGSGLRPADSIRLFMVPGMGHCGGGEGPNSFDMMGALEQWKEQVKMPVRSIASHHTGGKGDRTRRPG